MRRWVCSLLLWCSNQLVASITTATHHHELESLRRWQTHCLERLPSRVALTICNCSVKMPFTFSEVCGNVGTCTSGVWALNCKDEIYVSFLSLIGQSCSHCVSHRHRYQSFTSTKIHRRNSYCKTARKNKNRHAVRISEAELWPFQTSHSFVTGNFRIWCPWFVMRITLSLPFLITNTHH